MFWSQIEANLRGTLNTWAIFWYATIYEHSGLCLNPVISFVDNIGLDGSGENCSRTTRYQHQKLNIELDLSFPENEIESSSAVRVIKSYYTKKKVPFMNRYLNKFRRLMSRI